ncbi:pentapeptide repeat-containing protein [Dongia sedimenti]|uniref:Pentapeptide repeat-containing protein n=1 Tax=Dongia sedimenti TaxID=3064282 RepID=A0ABU0YG51_9PROT|nr:pentapeptide repeat-containing protein [Rhodospirillaceae bacterium R-7]
MFRLIAAVSVLLAISHSPTFACSPVPVQVTVEPLTGIVQEVPTPQRTPEQIAETLPEVVIDGVVIERDPISGEPGATTDSYNRHARMRVDRVWKGEAAAFVTLEFGEDTAMCQQVPPVGTPIRISPDPVSPNVFSYDVLSGWATGDPSEDAGLQLYRDRTVAMQRKAEAGGRAEKLAFADYLRRNGETHRALWLYEALLQQDPSDLDSVAVLAVLQAAIWKEKDAQATLNRLSQIAPRTEAWRGKIARATFEATGVLAADWKNYSDVANVVSCRSEAALDGADFSGAQLRCDFAGSTFRNANFKGSDLSWARFEDVDLKGALYDCATEFAADFDPVAAGMVNVDGSCSAPQ